MNKKIKTLCLSLCGTALLGAGTFAVMDLQNANAATELVIPQEYVIESEYTYGEIFHVPAPSTVRIKTGTVETTAVSVTLRFPDGTAKSEGAYTLDKNGAYELTYYNANGVSATQKFVVNKNYYGVEEGTTASYVTDLVGVPSKEGISVTLKDGKSFTYNKSINLNDHAGEALEICKIFPMFRTSADLNPDASTVSVKIVDCYDSSKFVEFYIWSCEAGQGAYYTGAGASTQSLTGLEQNRNRPHEMTEPYDGQLYKIHRPHRYQSKTAWGTAVSSKYNDQLIEKDGVVFIWDLATHQMKVRNGGNAQVITDIDSSEIYGEKAFDYSTFFTTGEVYVNFEAYNYATSSFTLGIEEIFGESGEALADGKMLDTQNPQVTVDVQPTVGNVVYLQKGKAVTLPTVSSVIDLNYYGDTNVSVYRNYGNRGEVLVNVENGVFVPDMEGNYTAVYTAKDGYGNEGKFLLGIVVLDEANFVYEKATVKKLVAAKNNILPYIPVSGLNLAPTAKVSVTAPDGAVVEVEYNGVDGYEYVPAYAGEYTVTYLFKDNVYEEKYSYKAACVDENAAIFQDAFSFPAYFMKGASYTIDPVVAYTAGNGAFKENEAVVSVSVDGGEYQTLTPAQMSAYKVEANQTLQFKATFGNNSILSKLYSVVDVGFGKKTTEKDYLPYWQGNYTSSELLEVGAAYTFGGDASLQFINPVSGKNFKTNFKVEAASAESVIVTLRDARNPMKNYVTYTYYQATPATVAVLAQQFVNGHLVFEKEIYTRYKSVSGEYTLAYSVAGMEMGGTVVSGVQPFAEDDTLIEIATVGTANGAIITVTQLNNQSFSQSIRESKPQMSYQESNGVFEINAIYKIMPCYASAVMCSVLTKDVKLTVYAPNGDVVTAVDGTRLEGVVAGQAYDIQLSQTGQYRISYEVSCIGSSRKSGEEVLSDDDYYIVNVSEGIAPTVQFTDGSNEKTTVYLSVGSTHTLKEYTVTDNVSSSEKIKVYTMVCDKGFMLEENGYDVDTYVFKNVGEFIVCVYAYDELGNSSRAYYNVVVS